MRFSVTVKFHGTEAALLDYLVRSGLFATKSEVIRAALVNYGADLGFLRAREMWATIRATRRRGVALPQLRMEVRKAEDAD